MCMGGEERVSGVCSQGGGGAKRAPSEAGAVRRGGGVGKTQLAQQQQMTAQAEHKAAQADLAEQLRDAASLIHQLDTRQIQLLSQASEDALTIQRQSEQASQLQADISAADAKAAAAEQHAHAQQQQLQAVIADRDAAYDHAKVLQGQVELVRELQEQLAAAHTAQGILQQDSKAHQLDVVHLKGQLKTASGDRDRLQDQLKAASSNAAQEGSLEQALADIEQLHSRASDCPA
ncbi:hypothetical protein WJX82_004229 [Trebouxia sp. C0006]